MAPADPVKVTLTISSQGVILLGVDYTPATLNRKNSSGLISSRLIEHYQAGCDRSGYTSCIVEIQCKQGSSPLVRALYDLWQEVVEKRGGQVICVSLPSDSINALHTLGLLTLPGFSLEPTQAAALARLAPRPVAGGR